MQALANPRYLAVSATCQRRMLRARHIPLVFVLLTSLVCSFGIPPKAFGQERVDTVRQAETIKPFRFGSRSLTPDLTAKAELVSRIGNRIGVRKALDPKVEPRAYVFVRLREVASQQARSKLEQQGVRLLDRIGPTTWIAAVSNAGAQHLADGDAAVWVNPIEPSAKIAPGLEAATIPAWRQRTGGALAFSVGFHKGVTASEVIALAATLDAGLEEFQADHFPVLRSAKFVMDPAHLADLAAAEGVARIGPSAPPPQPDNEAAVQPLSNVDVVHGPPYNLTGANVSVGVWEANEGTAANPETAIRDTHNNLTPRVQLEADQAGPPASGFSDHASGVAGTLGAADNPVLNVEGMAPGVTIASWSNQNDLNEMISAVTSAGAAGDPTPIVISNHSYGVYGGWIFRRGNPAAIPPTTDRFLYRNNAFFGRYTFRAEGFDAVVVAQDLMIFKSAGNERNDDRDPAVVTATLVTDPGDPDMIPPPVDPPADCNTGGLTTPLGADVDADCLSPVASAKNIFTIGSADGAGAIADFSSFGPTDDGRIKPDLLAQGVNVTTTAAGADNATEFSASGTSISSPAVAGVAALMLEQADDLSLTVSAAGMKALLLHTAIDFTADPYVRAVGELPEAMIGPDYASGWGIVDAEAAADLLRLPGGPGLVEGTLTLEGVEGRLRYPLYFSDSEPELKVSLAWSDPAGAGLAEPAGAQDAVGSTAAEGPGTAVGVVPSVLVNDLDLVLVSPNGIRHLPWSLDPEHPERPARRNGGRDDRNNVEQVSVLAPEAGLWWAEVSAGMGAMPSDPQAFALAGPLSGLKIVEPTRDAPARAGSPSNGSRVLVRLRASGGLDLSLANLRVEVDGDVLAAGQVSIHSVVGRETWLVIAPGARPVGCYDLEVSLVDLPDVTDRARQSLCYEDIATAVVDRVVAVDRTNSMRYNSITRNYSDEKLVSARDAASAFVTLSNDQDAIGLVQFQLVDANGDSAVEQDELAQVVQPLIVAFSSGTDHRLAVRTLAEGITPAPGDWSFRNETSIGAAIAVSKAELDANAQTNARRVIALVTDGRENYPPYWSREDSGEPLKPEILLDSGLVIHTVGIGQDAEHEVLKDIADSTEGRHFPPFEGESSYSLLSRLTSIFKEIDEDVRGEQRFYYKEGVPTKLVEGEEFLYEGGFTVEPFLDWMTVSFHWAPKPSDSGVVLLPPASATPVEPLSISDDKHTIYRVLGPAPGEWRYQVPSSILSSGEFTAIASGPTLLTARLRTGGTVKASGDVWSTPLRVWIAENTAVSDATVTGTIIRPDRSKRAITLLDNGSSADGAGGDGVYGLVVDETIPGAYRVDITASREDGDAQLFERHMAGSFVIPGRPAPPPQVGEGRPGGGFCGGGIWCCWLWAAFLIAYMVTLWAILKLICSYRRKYPADAASHEGG